MSRAGVNEVPLWKLEDTELVNVNGIQFEVLKGAHLPEIDIHILSDTKLTHYRRGDGEGSKRSTQSGCKYIVRGHKLAPVRYSGRRGPKTKKLALGLGTPFPSRDGLKSTARQRHPCHSIELFPKHDISKTMLRLRHH
jgi:hypothetical protein